jgi:hypothetical protein
MFWIREILGWLLIALGLYVFWIAMQMLLREGPFILEAPGFIAIGFIVFRGGLHLVKVAMASRVCLAAQQAALARDLGRDALRNRGRDTPYVAGRGQQGPAASAR